MNFRLSKWEGVYFILVVLLFMILAGFTIKSFYSSGLKTNNSTLTSNEILLILKDIEQDSPLERINYLMRQDRSRKALVDLKQLENKTKKVARSKDLKEISVNKNGIKSLQGLRGKINLFLDLPNGNEVLRVFMKKNHGFRAIAVRNKWKRLEYMSKKVNSEIMRFANLKNSDWGNIANLIRKIEGGISYMRKVTRSSTLKSESKVVAFTKISHLNEEFKILKSYEKKMAQYKNKYLDTKKVFERWLSKSQEHIAFKNLASVQNIKNIQYILIANFSLGILALMGFYFVRKKSLRNNKNIINKLVLNMVKKTIVSSKMEIDEVEKSLHSKELRKYSAYVRKVTSIGSMFQDSIPFPSIILDNNLCLTWGNKLFYELIGVNIEQNNGDKITWDHVKQYTSLGRNDQIFSALREKVAGIYQVKIKNNVTSDLSPFEMYVTPTGELKNRKIMIFFYPLKTMEETINLQTQSVIEPILKTIEMLKTSKFKEDFKLEIEKDYQSAGISEVMQGFSEYDFLNQSFQEGLVRDLNKKIIHNNEYCKTNEEIAGIVNKTSGSIDKILGCFNGFKNNLIDVNQLHLEFERDIEVINDDLKNIELNNEQLHEINRDLREKMNKSLETLGKIKTSKNIQGEKDLNIHLSKLDLILESNVNDFNAGQGGDLIQIKKSVIDLKGKLNVYEKLESNLIEILRVIYLQFKNLQEGNEKVVNLSDKVNALKSDEAQDRIDSDTVLLQK